MVTIEPRVGASRRRNIGGAAVSCLVGRIARCPSSRSSQCCEEGGGSFQGRAALKTAMSSMDDLLEALDGLGDSGFQEEEEEEGEGEEDSVARVGLSELSEERFREEFLLPRRPVVIEDHAGVCVPLHLTAQYFADVYGRRSVPVDFGGAGERVVELDAYLAFSDPELRPLYLRNLQVRHSTSPPPRLWPR